MAPLSLPVPPHGAPLPTPARHPNRVRSTGGPDVGSLSFRNERSGDEARGGEGGGRNRGRGGIGLALAERFARDGLNVVLADVQADALANAADQVGALGVETLAVPTDVSDEAAVQALAAAAVERFGGVHVVVQ